MALVHMKERSHFTKSIFTIFSFAFSKLRIYEINIQTALPWVYRVYRVYSVVEKFELILLKEKNKKVVIESQ